MKVENRTDGSMVRRVLTGMIVDDAVIRRIAAQWDGKLFKARWANLIGEWCVTFCRRYDKAPRKSIEGLFDEWSRKADKDTVKLIDKFLSGLSGEYNQRRRESNSDFVIDEATKLFNRVKLDRLAESIQEALADGDTEKALKKVAGHNQVEISAATGIDVLHDMNAVKRAFEEKKEPLIKYTGALGRFFGDVFERDAFVSFMGPEKRGKTWWLLDLAWRAMQQRRKVAFFEVGDLSEHQIMRRFMIRAAKRPLKAGVVRIPESIEMDEDSGETSVLFKERKYKQGLGWQAAWEGCQKALKRTRSKDTYLKLAVHPNSTLSVDGMRAVLDGWDRNNWLPDVIVIDYADILAPPVGMVESLDQINATWKQLRSLSQQLHGLVATATQTNAASYQANTVGRQHFSGNKLKLAHVTAMIGLNQSDSEKEQGVMRLNFVAQREAEYSEGRCVHVAGCLGIANPALKSTF